MSTSSPAAASYLGARPSTPPGEPTGWNARILLNGSLAASSSTFTGSGAVRRDDADGPVYMPVSATAALAAAQASNMRSRVSEAAAGSSPRTGGGAGFTSTSSPSSSGAGAQPIRRAPRAPSGLDVPPEPGSPAAAAWLNPVMPPYGKADGGDDGDAAATDAGASCSGSGFGSGYPSSSMGGAASSFTPVRAATASISQSTLHSPHASGEAAAVLRVRCEPLQPATCCCSRRMTATVQYPTDNSAACACSTRPPPLTLSLSPLCSWSH